MAFQKRSVGLSRRLTSEIPSADQTDQAQLAASPVLPSGTRPSPIDGRLTTSTGTPSLDALLAGHAGLSLGNSLLFLESGTTDHAGALLRYYAAEGVMQGHKVYVLGMGEQWGRNLPGVVGGVEELDAKKSHGREREKMKIAWRYEGLGNVASQSRAATERSANAPKLGTGATPFCHVFDLAKRLELPASTSIEYPRIDFSASPGQSPFAEALINISEKLSASPADTIHRLIVPSLLSPALYPLRSCAPQYVLSFLHALRGLLKKHAQCFTAMITLPLELFPRSTGVIRWAELLAGGVMELTPFPHRNENTSGAATSQEEQPQGMFKVHKLPVFHERGGGGGDGGRLALGNDLAFTVSRRRFEIKPFSLPPAEGDNEAQDGNSEGKPTKLTKDSIEF